MVALAMVAIVAMIHAVSGSLALAGVAVAALAISLWRFLLPAEIELSPDGVVFRGLGRTRRIDWRRIGRYEIQRRGVLILPETDSAPLDYLRGLYLPWRDHRDEVLALLDRYLPTRGGV